MTKLLSDLNNNLTFVPFPQSAARAGTLANAATNTLTAWTDNNWLECDGSAVSRSTYADLFANIGTKYGIGDGSTTFNLPDGPWQTFQLDLNVTGTNSWSTTRAKGFIKKFSDGTLRLIGNIRGSTAATTSVTVTVTGVTFPGVDQAGTVSTNTVGTALAAHALASTSGNFKLEQGSSRSAWWFSFDVEITAIPADTFVASDSRFTTFIESIESIPVIKAYNDSSNISMSLADATATRTGAVRLNADFEGTGDSFGFVKKNKTLVQESTVNYTTNTTGILSKTNIPDGIYKITVGADYYYQQTGANVYITPQLNNSAVPIPGGDTWEIGPRDDASVSPQTYMQGFSSTRIVTLGNGTNSFDLDITISGGSSFLNKPYYILEKLENYEEITTEWD